MSPLRLPLLLLLLLAAAVVLLCAPHPAQAAALTDTVKLAELHVLPRYKIFKDYMGLYANPTELIAIRLDDARSRLVTESSTLINQALYKGNLYYMRGLGIYTYDWENGWFIIQSTILSTMPWTMVVAPSHGMYWIVDRFAEDAQLWRSEGTPDSTKRVIDPNIPKDFNQLVSLKEKIFMLNEGTFSYYSPATGAVFVKRFCTLQCSNPRDMIYVGNTLYFVGYDQVDTGFWKSDLTTDGTVKICNTATCKDPLNPVALKTRILFFKNTGTLTLHALNVTAMNTSTNLGTFANRALITDMPDGVAVVGNFAYFLLAGTDALKNCLYVYRSDGTPGNTGQYTPPFCIPDAYKVTGGFFRSFQYSPNGTEVTTFAFQALILNDTSTTVTNATSVFLTIYEPFEATWYQFATMCRVCIGNRDYAEFFDGFAWYFTDSGLHEIVIGNEPPNYGSSGSPHLAPNLGLPFLVSLLLGLLFVSQVFK